ncbi:Holliday junction DNA helicase RuvA [Candidatus Campbellbacteria bacterium RIFCSPLOWO2_01_FULL_34_15]|uniref:Holliday junction branch migration complex subunit RuvA n=2 Tax=Candidatus Campbelliibacteriota TaxID=1752727 RepID=A0A1F5ELM4_9BACT|nr:MAG: Holliday junction DNA helicase RuvA [Candidatus Campbellbacteria bacterium RIFCSPHIGHO2_01_FULL_34_10]OGD68312.1 MAG: Holliday junction DNA helicase RuvA [Candidatus Campbellbacteria bacterium RIFCSPLOWO2_01_FULL_34_15]
MISQLTGKISFIALNHIVLNVNGVGYKVFVSNETIGFAEEDSITTLWTHLAVRENAMDLYGFSEKSDLNFFELLLTISGIGPKSALGILNTASAETLRSAISSGDTSYLTKVSGIGSKSAQKIVLELQDKIGKIEGGARGVREEVDAVETLKSLGYSAREASDALKKVDKEITGTGGRVKEALKILSK